MNSKAKVFLTKPTQKSSDQLLAFTNFYQHAKYQFIPSVHFWDRVNLEFSWPDWPHPFLTMSTPNIFNHPLICLNLYQHAKNQLFHQFIFEILSILDFCYQTGHTHFWPCPPKSVWSAFNFCECINMHKTSYSTSSFFECREFLNPFTRLATLIFDHAHPQNFPSFFNLREFVPVCKKTVNSICSFLKYIQI